MLFVRSALDDILENTSRNFSFKFVQMLIKKQKFNTTYIYFYTSILEVHRGVYLDFVVILNNFVFIERNYAWFLYFNETTKMYSNIFKSILNFKCYYYNKLHCILIVNEKLIVYIKYINNYMEKAKNKYVCYK